MRKESDVFYWKDDFGRIQEAPVARFRELVFWEARQPGTPTGENPGESVRPERGKTETEADHPKAMDTAVAERKII